MRIVRGRINQELKASHQGIYFICQLHFFLSSLFCFVAENVTQYYQMISFTRLFVYMLSQQYIFCAEKESITRFHASLGTQFYLPRDTNAWYISHSIDDAHVITDGACLLNCSTSFSLYLQFINVRAECTRGFFLSLMRFLLNALWILSLSDSDVFPICAAFSPLIFTWAAINSPLYKVPAAAADADINPFISRPG